MSSVRGFGTSNALEVRGDICLTGWISCGSNCFCIVCTSILVSDADWQELQVIFGALRDLHASYALAGRIEEPA